MRSCATYSRNYPVVHDTPCLRALRPCGVSELSQRCQNTTHTLAQGSRRAEPRGRTCARGAVCVRGGVCADGRALLKTPFLTPIDAAHSRLFGTGVYDVKSLRSNPLGTARIGVLGRLEAWLEIIGATRLRMQMHPHATAMRHMRQARRSEDRVRR